MTLSAGEFIRRFLIHVLPKGFQRIRYYGYLGNRYRKEKLARCRDLIGMQQPVDHEKGTDYCDKVEEITGVSPRECPACHHGRMICIEVLERIPSSPPPALDTS